MMYLPQNPKIVYSSAFFVIIIVLSVWFIPAQAKETTPSVTSILQNLSEAATQLKSFSAR